jgi:hypothetical protein
LNLGQELSFSLKRQPQRVTLSAGALTEPDSISEAGHGKLYTQIYNEDLGISTSINACSNRMICIVFS